MSLIEPAKNKENYFVIKVAGVETEDFEDLCRPYWRCTETVCPFPGCSENAWHRVKSDLWSVESEDCVRSYIKQHGMESVLHGRRKDNPVPEDRIDSIVRDADIEMSEDTWNDRQVYRTQMNQQEQGRKRKREKQDDDQWHNSAGASSSDWYRETDSQNAILQTLTTLTQSVGILAAGKAPGAVPPAMPVTSALMAGPSCAELRAVPHFINSAIEAAAVEQLENGATLSVHEKMVSVPFSTLMLCKETTTRSKEACKQALASMLTPMNQLRVELGVLSNTEAVLDEIIAKAKNS